MSLVMAYLIDCLKIVIYDKLSLSTKYVLCIADVLRLIIHDWIYGTYGSHVCNDRQAALPAATLADISEEYSLKALLTLYVNYLNYLNTHN